MLEAILGNGVRTYCRQRLTVCLRPDRSGDRVRLLRDLGITLLAADGHDFSDETPTAVMIRQILGSSTPRTTPHNAGHNLPAYAI
jgi:hypothetical protein